MADTLWVFGYGSLIWHPGFEPAERVLARAEGWHRSFCMLSVHYRGTSERPGLVLALDAAEAAACAGVAFAVRHGEEARVLQDLRARELISSAYLEQTLPLQLADGRRVTAVTYVINTAHAQYCGGLDLERQARMIAAAHGGRGPNAEYLFNTAENLHALGIADPDIDWLAERVRALRA